MSAQSKPVRDAASARPALSPCPRCKAAPEYDGDPWGWCVYCPKCFDDGADAGNYGVGSTKTAAFEAWNSYVFAETLPMPAKARRS